MRILSSISFVILSLAIVPSLPAALNQVQIVVEKKLDKTEKKKAASEGDVGSQGTEVTYEIKLADTAFTDLSDLKVDYVIFVERQRLGQKKDRDVVVRVSGTAPVAMLTKKEPQTVTTKVVQLSKASLTGNFHYEDGGRIKVEDSIKGVWIRVSQGEKIVGEYTNPSTVTTRGWDKK